MDIAWTFIIICGVWAAFSYYKIKKFFNQLAFYIGNDIGSLTFRLIKNIPGQENNNSVSLSIFSKNGTQSAKWLKSSVRLEPEDINYDFKLAIDGVVGKGYKGEIFFSDFFFKFF